MDRQANDTVARQATFDTDPDRAKIKRGTLKLPVIQGGENNPPSKDSKGIPSDKNTSSAKSGQTSSADKSKSLSSKDKQGKDSLNNHRKSDTTGGTNTKDASVSEKQKKLNALNESRKASTSNTRESDNNEKEPNRKAKVLNSLNAKRGNSPEKRQSPPKITETGGENSESTSKPSKKLSNSEDTNAPSAKGSREQDKVDKNTSKETKKDAKLSGDDTKLRPAKDVIDVKEKKAPERSRSPTKKAAANSSVEDKKVANNSKKHSDTLPERSKVVKRDSSPNKRVKSPPKQLSPSDLDLSKTLKAKKQSGNGEIVPKLNNTSKPDQTQTIKRDKSPEKTINKSPQKLVENKESPSKSTRDKKVLLSSDLNILDHVSTQDKDNIFNSNKPPAGTKLNDIKQVSTTRGENVHDTKNLTENNLLNDIPDEKEHKDLTAAVALLVSEGENSNQTNENGRKYSSANIKPINTSSNKQDNVSLASEINESKDNLPELKVSNDQKNEELEHLVSVKSNNKDIVRQTYVVSPSPTKFDSPKVNRPDLVVEQIEIETRPKGSKMQGRESYEQVYAERNTLLKAEHTYRKRIKQLEDEANSFLRTIEDLTSENKLLRDRVDQLENKQRNTGDDNAYEKISELEKEKGQLESRVKKLEHLANSNANANESTDTMQKEIRELKAQVIKLQTDNQTINEENIKLKAENYENMKKIHAIEANASSLAKSAETDRSDKVQDLENARTRSDHENVDLKTKNEKLQKKVDALEYENNTLSETLDQKKHELKEIMTVMKDENKFDNEIKDLKNLVLKLQKEKEDTEAAHTKELRTVTSKLQETKARLDDTSKEIYELKIKFDETEKENDSLKDSNANLTKIKESQDKEIERLKAEIERLKKALQEANDKYDKVVNDTKSTSTELRTAKETAEELNRDLQKIIADKETQINKLISQLDSSNKDKDFVTQALKKEKEQLSNENNRLKVFEANMGRMELELKQVVTKYEEAELRNKQLNIQLQDRGFECSNLEQQIFELNMKLDNSSRRINQLDKDKRELEEDRREWAVKKEKVSDIESSNRRLIDENKRLRSQLEVTSYSLDYKPSEPEKEKPVVEAWISDVSASSKPSQQALYVQKEKKKVTIVPHPTMAAKKPFSKSKQVKAAKTGSNKKEDPRNSVRSSRSLEDLRRTPDQRTPDSEASLPELQKETRLTTYGGYGTYGGYAQIHKNRIRQLHKKVY